MSCRIDRSWKYMNWLTSNKVRQKIQIGCPTWIRTMNNASKGRCVTITPSDKRPQSSFPLLPAQRKFPVRGCEKFACRTMMVRYYLNRRFSYELQTYAIRLGHSGLLRRCTGDYLSLIHISEPTRLG